MIRIPYDKQNTVLPQLHFACNDITTEKQTERTFLKSVTCSVNFLSILAVLTCECESSPQRKDYILRFAPSKLILMELLVL